MAALKAFWNSPVGPKTTHFWGPVANWGFVIAVRFLTSLADYIVYSSFLYSKHVSVKTGQRQKKKKIAASFQK